MTCSSAYNRVLQLRTQKLRPLVGAIRGKCLPAMESIMTQLEGKDVYGSSR